MRPGSAVKLGELTSLPRRRRTPHSLQKKDWECTSHGVDGNRFEGVNGVGPLQSGWSDLSENALEHDIRTPNHTCQKRLTLWTTQDEGDTKHWRKYGVLSIATYFLFRSERT